MVANDVLIGNIISGNKMATTAATNYAKFRTCISTYRRFNIFRKCNHMCIKYSGNDGEMFKFRAFSPELAMSRRSLCSLTQKLTPSSRSACLLCDSVVVSLVPLICLKQRKDNYASHAKRPRSRTHYYNVLSITPNATQSQIKEAYYRLSKLYHPDINKEPSAHVLFSEISEAYEVLGNIRKRRMYDRGVYNPQRYKDEDDLDAFHEEEGFTSRRKPPPTGHTSTYNFDEFYRQHYGESRKRQGENRAMYEAYLRQLQEEENQKKTSFMILMMVLSIGVAFWYSALASVHKISAPKPKKKD